MMHEKCLDRTTCKPTSIGCSVPPTSIAAELKKLGMENMLVSLREASSETKKVSEDEVSVNSI